MRRRISSATIAVGFALALQAPPASATQALMATVHANAFGAGFPIDPKSDVWSAPLGPRDLAVASAYHSLEQGVPSAESHAAVMAHWASADSGTATFVDDGVTVAQPPRLDNDLMALYGASWSYRFMADRDGVLNFDLQAAFTGDQDDIGTWRVGAADFVDPNNVLILDADGYSDGNTLRLTGSLRLTAGRTYVVAAANSGDSRNVSFPGLLQGAEHATVTWSIVSDPAGAPESGAWALMLLGFAAAGARLRATRPPMRRPA